MPCYGNPAAVQAPAELRNGRLDEVELVEDALHVFGPRPPVQRRLGVIGIEAQRLRAQMGRLDHDEAVRRPEVGERAVAVQ